MVVVDRAALGGCGRADAGDDAGDLVGCFGAACQPVPNRAVRRIAASDEPPIHIGRSGCTGFGEIEAPDRW